MQKKLPKIYQSSFSHKIDNNAKVFYSASTATPMSKELKIHKEQSVEEVLEELFQGTGHIFNIPVEIVTPTKRLDTRIAGKVRNTIITLDNDVINVSEIISIKRKDR